MSVESAKLIVEVTCGLIPGQAEDKFTRRWAITSREWEEAQAKDDAQEDAELKTAVSVLLETRAAEADAYARLLRNPARFNHVRVEWIWL